MKLRALLLRTVALAIPACATCFGGTVITTPAGLAPGTQYQLAFVTADQFFATSTSISDYNTAVSNEAALNATLAAFDTAHGVTWTMIGSTTSVNANVNAASTGLVYTLDGTRIASAANSLYSGSLLAPLDIDQNGNALSIAVWTGSVSGGTVAGGINDLGQTFPEYGSSTSTTSGWIAGANGTFSNNNLSYYALSSVITVAPSSAAPEPGTLLLLPAAFVLIAAFKKSTSSRTGSASKL